MKKIVWVTTLSLLGLAIVGCGQTSNSKAESSSKAVNSSEEEKQTEEQKKPDEYKGLVKEEGSRKELQIVLSSLKQTKESDSPVYFDEVILLVGGVPILDEKTQETRLVEEIKAGTTITVFLEPNPIATMSIPPQIPGNSISKILIIE